MALLKVFLLSVAVLKLTSAVPPPGYVKKPDNDKDPPKYQYGYDVTDGAGSRQGHAESRDGIYAQGQYYVSAPGSGQRVQYFADDWGYHPLVSYGSNTKSSSSNAQFAYGEKAVSALRQSGGGLAIGSPITSNFPSRALKAPTVLTPVSNYLRQGPVVTSTYLLNNGQQSLVIDHQQNTVGVSQGSPQSSYQNGGQVSYQQNLQSVTPQPPLQLRQQQRLSATLQVGPSVAPITHFSSNNIGQGGSSYVVQGSAGGQLAAGGANSVANVGHGQSQYFVEVKTPSYQGGSEAAANIIGASQLALQQTQQYSGAGSSESQSVAGGATSTSYSSQTSGNLAYGSKLSSTLTTGSSGGGGVSFVQKGNEINTVDQVVAVTPASIEHTSLKPIVVAELQNQDVQVATPTPQCNCPSSTAATLLLGLEEGKSSTFQSTTAGVALSTESSAYNTVGSHVTTEQPLFLQSTTTAAPPFYISNPLSSSARSESSASSTFITNNGDSGHIDEPAVFTSQPSNVVIPTVRHEGYIASSFSTVSPPSPTIVITPKPQPIAEALSYSHELLAPFQAALNLAAHNIQTEEAQSVTKITSLHPVVKDNFRYKTVVEVQKAIPIEVSQDNLNADDEAQIQENGIPIGYIQQIVQAAENNLQGNGQGDYGYKLNSISTYGQSDIIQGQEQVQTSNSAASEGQIQAQIAGEAEQVATQINNQEEGSAVQTQVIINEPLNVPQLQSGPYLGPTLSTLDQNNHALTHQFHKQVISHIEQPQIVQVNHQVHVPRPVFNLKRFRPLGPLRYGQKIPQRSHRFNHNFFRSQQNKAPLELNQEFLNTNQNLLQSQEAREQEIINQAALASNQQIFNVGSLNNAEIPCESPSHAVPQQIINQQTTIEDQQVHAAGHQLNQQLLEGELNKLEDQRSQDLVGSNQQLVGVIDNNPSEFQQQLDQGITNIINNNNQELQNFANLVNSQQLVQQQQQLQQQPGQQLEQQQVVQNAGNVPQIAQNVVSIVGNQQQQTVTNVVSKINNQQTVLQQQYNRQLLANTVRKPTSSALAQQAINTNHQQTLKFIRQPEGDKQAELEKDYNEQLKEEREQDGLQAEKQLANQGAPLKLLLEAEKQTPLNLESQALDNIGENLQLLPTPLPLQQEALVGVLSPQPEVLPLQQVEQSALVGQAPILPTVPLQDSLPLPPNIFSQQNNYLDSFFFQQPFPIEHTKVVPVDQTKVIEVAKPVPVHIEHTKIHEIKNSYPVPYPVRVEHTRIVNVDRPYAVPHPIPIEVTKLVPVDRPWPYPQPYPVPHPVPVPYAVPHPVQVPVNHYIHYPHIVRVPVKEQQSTIFSSGHGAALFKPPMPPNPHFQREAAHAYLRSHYGFGFNPRPHFNYKNKAILSPSRPFKDGRSLTHIQQQQLLSRHRPKVLNIEYGFKPPLIPSLQIAVDPEPEPEPFAK